MNTSSSNLLLVVTPLLVRAERLGGPDVLRTDDFVSFAGISSARRARVRLPPATSSLVLMSIVFFGAPAAIPSLSPVCLLSALRRGVKLAAIVVGVLTGDVDAIIRVCGVAAGSPTRVCGAAAGSPTRVCGAAAAATLVSVSTITSLSPICAAFPAADATTTAVLVSSLATAG